MYYVAVCDDSLKELNVVTEYIKEYIETSGIDAEIKQFAHPDKLLDACEKERFHIYILDIVMPMVNGIEVGRGIRRLDREAQIVYITTEPGFALEAFSANPINYLVKPVDKIKLFDTLTLAVSKVDSSEESVISIKTKDGTRVMKLASIVYCEYAGHIAVFGLTNGEKVSSVSMRAPFGTFAEQLICDRRFVQTHASYVINMNYVEGFSRDGFTLRGKIAIPIAKALYAEVRNRYMDYILSKEGSR